MSRITVEADRAVDHLVLRWTDGSRSGSCRFDRLAGTRPEWLGSADELLEGADRRSEARVLDAAASWARDAGVEIGLWHDDAGIEILD